MQQNYTKVAGCQAELVTPELGVGAAEADCPEFKATVAL